MTVLDGDWQPRTLTYKKLDLNGLELLADRSFSRYIVDQPVVRNEKLWRPDRTRARL
jgi:hypothetical protein